VKPWVRARGFGQAPSLQRVQRHAFILIGQTDVDQEKIMETEFSVYFGLKRPQAANK